MSQNGRTHFENLAALNKFSLSPFNLLWSMFAPYYYILGNMTESDIMSHTKTKIGGKFSM